MSRSKSIPHLAALLCHAAVGAFRAAVFAARALARQAARLKRASEAVAAVEFALILPGLLTLYIGSVEVSSAITADNRVATVASSVGDLVARTRQQLSTSELDDYFSAAGNIMQPYASTNLKQVVTCVFVANDGTTTVKWSRGYNGGMSHTVNDPYSLPQELIDMSKGKYVIVSEAQLAYDPIIGYVFNSAFQLYHEDFHLPRYGEYIDLTS